MMLAVAQIDQEDPVSGSIDYDGFDALTFDCYGTLIDWEAGILAGLRPALEAHGVRATDDEVLEAYSTVESALEAGPYLRYRSVLERAFREVCRTFGVEAGEAAAEAFGSSVGAWPAFPDSTEALRALRQRFRLGVITNCDDDLFAASNRRLAVEFEWVVTAQSVGSYKPNPANFEAALAIIDVPRDRILHVAQSLFHDHVPAKRLGLRTAWINRRQGRPGSGATPPATAEPDATFPDMATFAAVATVT